MSSSTIWAPVGEQGPPGPPGPEGPIGPAGPAGPGLDAYIALIASSAGSSNVGFIQAGTGAVTRTAQAKMRDIISVKDFGAVGDGVADDTAAMLAAHTTGKVIFYPEGTYKFTKFTFAAGGIIGEGRTATVLQTTNADASNVITFTGNNPPLMNDFTLMCPAISNLPVKTGGSGMAILPTTGECSYPRFENVLIAFAPTCLTMQSAPYAKIEGCEFLGYNVAGVVIENVVNPDNGDSVIIGSLFNTPGILGDAITQYSSGGLKVLGNKMLGGANGFALNYRGASNSGVLVLNGNSIENMASSCISLARQSGSSNFSNIVITGNELAVSANGLFSDANNFISEFIFANNVVNIIGGTGATYGLNISTITDFYIGGNVFKGNGGTPAGIAIAASCVNGKVGKNVYSTLTTSIVNSSTTTVLDKDRQVGTSTTASSGWSGFGSLFSSPATSVSFGRTFTVAPLAADINMTVTSTNGACSALITGVSTTGFTYIALSSVTNIAASFSYTADGII